MTKKVEDSVAIITDAQNRRYELEELLAQKITEKTQLLTELEAIQSKNTDLTEKNIELEELVRKQQELIRKTLEKSVTSSVRLCVVAPTVNVHVGDNNKIKLQTG